MIRGVRFATLAAVTAVGSSCAQVWGLPDRHLDPHLACDGGACACTGGFGNCDGDDANGCETALESDAANCGACGRSCLGAACTARQCAPVVVYDFQDPMILATFALDGGTVYLANCVIPPAIGGVPAGGGPLATVVADGCAKVLAVDGGALLWAGGPGAIHSTPVAAPQSSTALTMAASPGSSFAAAGGYVYWDDFPGGTTHSLSRVSRGGAVQAVKTTAAEIWPLVCDGARVYWADEDGIASVPHAWSQGQPIDELVPMAGAQGMSLANGALYWSGANQAIGRISRLALQNGVPAGAPQEISVPGNATAIAVDETHVYWIDPLPGNVSRTLLDGTTTERLASGLDFSTLPYFTIALDAQAAYFGTSTQVLRVAK
jgi:hypothetical protein